MSNRTGFSIELWDQFEEVYRKISMGKEFTQNAVDFFHKRAAIEKEYAKKLQQLCKSTEKESYSLMNGWNSVKEETENISRKHQEFSEQILHVVEDPLNNFLKETRKTRNNLRDQGRKLLKDLSTAEGKTQSTKASYEQARKKQDETKEEYDRATLNNQQSPQVEKLAKKMKIDAKKAATADKRYSEAVDACRNLQNKFFEQQMPNILDGFQNMEQSRIDIIKSSLLDFVDLQRKLSPELLSSCDRILSSAQNISSQADIEAFIQEKRTGAPQPARCEYETYSTELGRCIKTDGSGGGSSSNTLISGPIISQPINEPQEKPAGIGKCRALYDYQQSDSNELSFSAGDVITILQKDPSGWWQGELDGRIGVFPSVDWVQEINESNEIVPPSNQPVVQYKCQANYDYAAQNQYEISIKAGETLTIEGEEEGWYCGTNSSGQFGRYPSNFCTLIQ